MSTSGFGTKRTSRDVRSLVAIGGESGRGADSPFLSRMTRRRRQFRVWSLLFFLGAERLARLG
jgi:hypothetical protein